MNIQYFNYCAELSKNLEKEFNIPINEACKKLGNASNDNFESFKIFGRSGIRFTWWQKLKIKLYCFFHKERKAQKIILDKIEKEKYYD